MHWEEGSERISDGRIFEAWKIDGWGYKLVGFKIGDRPIKVDHFPGYTELLMQTVYREGPDLLVHTTPSACLLLL